LKKKTVQVLGFIEIMILLGAFTLFALQNPNTLILFLNYATKQLDLSYSKVHGNLLKTIKIEDITYQGKTLTKEAVVDWNIKALLTASLKIDEISIKELDVPVTEEWINHLREKFSSKKKKKSISNIPTIEVSELFFSALPFQNDTISINRIELFAKEIKGDLREVDIGFFSFLTQSNYANITALGKLEQNRLAFDKLWLEEIDIEKIVRFAKTYTKKTTEDQNQTKPKPTQKFVKEIYVDNMIVYIKPLHYKHYQIDQSSVAIRGLVTSDLKNYDAKKIFIDTVTNMWKLSSAGKIKENTLISKVDVTLNDAYFKRFVPFFNHDAIHPITIDLQVNKEGLSADLQTKTDHRFLIKKYRDLNVSIPKLDAHVDFDFKKIYMKGDINASVQSKYTHDAKVQGHIYFDKTFFYDGNLSIKKFQSLPPQLSLLLKNSLTTFKGNTKHIEAHLKSDHLYADYEGKDYIHPVLSFRSKQIKPIQLFPTLPKIFEEVESSFKGTLPMNYKKFFPLQPKVELFSNLFDINTSILINKNINAKLHLTQTKKSLLNSLLPNLRQKAFFPLNLDLTYHEGILDAFAKNQNLNLEFKHHFKPSFSDITLHHPIHKLKIVGNLSGENNVTFQTPSLREFQNYLHSFYKFNKLPLDGDVTLQSTTQKFTSAKIKLNGKWFVYEYKPNKFLFAEKIGIDANYAAQRLTLNNYHFNTYLDRDRYFFAKKPSSALFTTKQIKVEKFYINDQASLNGYYHYKKKRGHFKLGSKNYHYKDIEGDVYFDANFEIALSPENTDIEGDLFLNRGTISYAPKKEHYVQDKDIIIIQDQKVVVKEKDTLSLDISIQSRQPIYYKIPNTDVKLQIDLKVWKEINKELELLGMVKILNGLHIQSGKEFEIDSSEIIFGGSPLNPYLNIRAIHRSEPYTIYINITGQLDAPLINFSATPYLTQSDILSLLLFNSTTNELISGNQDTSKTAISMFGSVFAKEIVRNFGIKLDKLVLTTTEEGRLGVELGKKISKKVTLIYINDIVQTIKIRYKLTDHFETDFIFSPDNSGIDIIYKDEY